MNSTSEESWFTSRQRQDFLLSKSLQTVLWPTRPLSEWAHEDISWGAKWPECKTNHPNLFNTENNDAWSVPSRRISKENGTDLKRWIGITCKLSRIKLRVQVAGRHMDWHILDFVLYWDKRIKVVVNVTDIFQVTVSWFVRLCSLEGGYRSFQ